MFSSGPVLLDAAGRPRHGANLPGAGRGRVPATKGRRFEPEPLTAEDIHALLRTIDQVREKGDSDIQAASRQRLRAIVVALWRTGLRISELLALTEHDLDAENRTLLVRRGKGGKRRLVQTDRWAWNELDAWLVVRETLPIGALFCVVAGPTAGRAMDASAVRTDLRRLAKRAGLRKRANPHTFRHSHAADLWREQIDILAIQRQLGHARLDVTQLYLRGICAEEVLAPIGERPAPTVQIGHRAPPVSLLLAPAALPAPVAIPTRRPAVAPSEPTVSEVDPAAAAIAAAAQLLVRRPAKAQKREGDHA
jgi:integrase